MKTMMFNPYTGLPRDPRDIQSDPAGLLMLDPDEPVRAAARRADALPSGWVAIPLEPSENEWLEAQGTFLDAGWDAVTCFAARIQALIAITRPAWRAANGTSIGPSEGS